MSGRKCTFPKVITIRCEWRTILELWTDWMPMHFSQLQNGSFSMNGITILNEHITILNDANIVFEIIIFEMYRLPFIHSLLVYNLLMVVRRKPYWRQLKWDMRQNERSFVHFKTVPVFLWLHSFLPLLRSTSQFHSENSFVFWSFNDSTPLWNMSSKLSFRIKTGSLFKSC